MEVINNIYKEYLARGGCSYNIKEGEFMNGQKYYSVALLDNKESIYQVSTFNIGDLKTFINNNMQLLKAKDNIIGVWKKDKNVYLDISTIIPKTDKKEAVTLAKKHNQRAIFDLEFGEEIIL